MVHGDDWNDDWVAVMERWGNARAAGYWECLLPPQRPTPEDGLAQSQFLKDFIFNKYGGYGKRRFAATGEPSEWLAYLPLNNGWVRYLDEASNLFYYHSEATGATEWEMPPGGVLQTITAQLTVPSTRVFICRLLSDRAHDHLLTTCS